MIRTRSQLEHVSKDELIDELLSIEDISSKVANLMTQFDNFSQRFEILFSELVVSKTAIASKWKNHPARKKYSQQCTISPTQIDRSKPCPCIN